jgi:hypothetical protein
MVLALSRKKLNTLLVLSGKSWAFEQDATTVIGNSAAKRHEVIAFGINKLEPYWACEEEPVTSHVQNISHFARGIS